jgi:hypothetical protein
VCMQAEQCHSLAGKLKQQYPDMASPVLIEAAQFVREKKADEAQKLLNVSNVVHLQSCFPCVRCKQCSPSTELFPLC